ncbi:MAG: sigma-70 family RNA polymerase sigma factor [Ruminococcaceae bacterium]|nr:sigma-70 family RNA polymerase sigma factor [Oscillospiraceae bacterium]
MQQNEYNKKLKKGLCGISPPNQREEKGLLSDTKANNLLPGEADLIASARSGDDNAFAALADFYKRVVDIQLCLCNPPEYMKDDLFQEGLIGLFKAVKTYDGKSAAFVTYATTCIRNNILSGIRKLSGQNALSAKTSFEHSETETVPSAEDVLIDSVRARALYETVCNALSPYEKLVFDMYLSDLSYEEIAFITKKSVKSTGNAVYRIRTKLKRILGTTEGVNN